MEHGDGRDRHTEVVYFGYNKEVLSENHVLSEPTRTGNNGGSRCSRWESDSGDTDGVLVETVIASIPTRGTD